MRCLLKRYLKTTVAALALASCGLVGSATANRAYACVDGNGATAACAEQAVASNGTWPGAGMFAAWTLGMAYLVYDDIAHRNGAKRAYVEPKPAVYVAHAANVDNGLEPAYTAVAQDVAGERQAQMKAQADRFAAAGYWPYNQAAATAVAATPAPAAE